MKKEINYDNQDFLIHYSKTPLLHHYSVFPAIFEEIGKFENKKILDVGCGYGDLANHFAERKAIAFGLDIAHKWRSFWEKTYQLGGNLNLKIGSGVTIETIFPEIEFDYITMNMVLLNVPSIKEIDSIFRSISNALKLNGKLIFTDLHPIALMHPNTTAEKQTYSSGFSYFKDGSQFRSSVLLSDSSWIEIEDIHWTLETYTRLLSKNGMVISKLIEPKPIENSPGFLKDYSVPEHLIFVCEKKDK